jgi:rhodanese-related sulfurtransferase
MSRHFTSAFLILLVSSAAAAAMNLLRPASLEWIRREMPSTNPPSPVADPAPAHAAAPSSIAANSTAHSAASPETGLSAETVLAHLRAGSARFVDAREEREYVTGHLRGSINIPSSAIYQHIGKLIEQVPPNEKIIVYCGGGDCEASHHVSDALQRDFKFADVTIYLKGWSEVDARRADLFNEWITEGTEP